MSVVTVGPALATVQKKIAGVSAAYAHDELPGALSSGTLPAFLNFPGPAEYTILSHGYVQEIREWKMQLYVAPRGRDVDAARLGKAVEPFFRRTFEAFLNSIQLEGLSGIVSAMLQDDTGWSVLDWGGVSYVGVEFTLQVIEKFTVTDYSS